MDASTSRYVMTEEIRQVSGFHRKSKQIQWLKSNRIKHTLNAYGQPVVLRSHWEAVMSEGTKRREESGPNWEGITA